MALHVVLRGLPPRERRLDGSTQEERCEGRLALNRELFLGAERAAARRKRDLDVLGRKRQAARDLRVVEPRALALRVDLHARSPGRPVLWDCQRRLGLEERDVDGLRAKAGLEDVGRGGEGRLDVAARELRGFDVVGRRAIRAGAVHLNRVL
jgi:hypothetical protein